MATSNKQINEGLIQISIFRMQIYENLDSAANRQRVKRKRNYRSDGRYCDYLMCLSEFIGTGRVGRKTGKVGRKV